MKNVFLVFLGGLLLAIVGADWNTASAGVNMTLFSVGFSALAVGILSDWKLSVPAKPAFMARRIDGIPPARTRARGE